MYLDMPHKFQSWRSLRNQQLGNWDNNSLEKDKNYSGIVSKLPFHFDIQHSLPCIERILHSHCTSLSGSQYDTNSGTGKILEHTLNSKLDLWSIADMLKSMLCIRKCRKLNLLQRKISSDMLKGTKSWKKQMKVCIFGILLRKCRSCMMKHMVCRKRGLIMSLGILRLDMRLSIFHSILFYSGWNCSSSDTMRYHWFDKTCRESSRLLAVELFRSPYFFRMSPLKWCQ